jgi:hypothetical protein
MTRDFLFQRIAELRLGAEQQFGPRVHSHDLQEASILSILASAGLRFNDKYIFLDMRNIQ